MIGMLLAAWLEAGQQPTADRALVLSNPAVVFAGAAFTTVAADPAASGTIYAATSSGAPQLLKSTDSSDTWMSVGPALNPPEGTVWVTADPTFPGRLYVAWGFLTGRFPVFEGLVYRSVDAGETWTGLPAVSVGAVVIDPTSPSTLYGIGPRIIAAQNQYPEEIMVPVRSLDFGDSWTELSFPNDFVRVFAVDPEDGTVLAGSFDGAFRSVDGGLSWTSTGLTGDVRAITFVPGTTTVFGGTTVGAFRSDDRGESWAPLSLVHAVASLAVDPRDSGLVYAAAYESGVFRSHDGGQTWTSMLVPGASAVSSIALNADGTRLYAATDAGVLRFDLPRPREIVREPRSEPLR